MKKWHQIIRCLDIGHRPSSKFWAAGASFTDDFVANPKEGKW